MQREPFRLFFPLALILAVAGVAPWALFSRGELSTWPGLPHALVMSQGFFLAVAIGFLGTMLPRRTGTPPLSVAALIGLGAATMFAGSALLAGYTFVAELAIIAVWLGLVVAAVRRVRAARQVPPPSFVLVAAGVLFGIAGAALAAAGAVGAPAWTTFLARELASQGVMVAMVLGVAPVLVPVVLTGQGARDGRTWPHVVVAALLVVSFAIPAPFGLTLRGVVAAVAIVVAGALRPATQRGAHRALFRLSLLLVPMGLLVAALLPEKRIALLHVAFGGGFSLMILAITVHVTLLHGGRADVASRWPAPVVAAGLLVLAATVVRALLEGFGERYVDAMFAAALLWIAAVVVWGAFLAPALRRPSSP